jgi:hypothetical protein
MTSARKIAADRRNALKSTGPRTRPGKARVARNARRHGLRTPLEAFAVVALSCFTEKADLPNEATQPSRATLPRANVPTKANRRRRAGLPTKAN